MMCRRKLVSAGPWFFLAILCGQLNACASKQADAIPVKGPLTLEAQKTQYPVYLSTEAKGTEKCIEYPFTLLNNTSRELGLELQRVSCTCMEVLEQGQGVPLAFGQQISLGPNARCNFAAKVRVNERDEYQKHLVTMTYILPEGHKASFDIPCEFRVLKNISASPPVLSHAWHEADESSIVKLVNIVTRSRKTTEGTEAVPAPTCEQLPRHVTIRSITESLSSSPDDGIVERHFSAEFVIARPKLDSRITTDFCIIRAGNQPTAPAVRIPISTEVITGITALPPVVVFSILAEGATDRTRRVLLKASDGQEFRILEITHSCPNLTIAQQEKKAGASHWLDVSLAGRIPDKSQHEVLIKTSHPVSQMVRFVVKQ
jgi:hypothetical protein